MAKPKTLVVYYSRSGKTRAVAEIIAQKLGCEIEELIDKDNRKGAFGWIKSGRDASGKRLAKIEIPRKDPADYDLVILGTPVWAWTMTPAIRTYLLSNAGSIKKTAFFCTMNGAGDNKTFAQMTELSTQQPIATLTIINKKQTTDPQKAIDDFIAKLT